MDGVELKNGWVNQEDWHLISSGVEEEEKFNDVCVVKFPHNLQLAVLMWY